MRFAVFALRPRLDADFLIFSYIRLFFAPFTPRGGIARSFAGQQTQESCKVPASAPAGLRRGRLWSGRGELVQVQSPRPCANANGAERASKCERSAVSQSGCRVPDDAPMRTERSEH